MRTFKKILLWLVIIIAMLVVISYLLPGKYTLERSIVTKADRGVVYDLVSYLQNWDKWTEWTKAQDSTVVFSMEGEDGIVGAKRTWIGKVLGNGALVITDLKPTESMSYDLSFNEGEMKSTGKIDLLQQGDSVKVNWTHSGELGYNPIYRYMGLFIDGMMAPDFEKGLARLKKVAEKYPPLPLIETVEISEFKALVIKDSCFANEIWPKMGELYTDIMAYISKNSIQPAGYPFSIWYSWDESKPMTMECGMPVKKQMKEEGRIKFVTIPGGKAVVARYFGPYDKTAPTYNALHRYVVENNFSFAAEFPMEEYVTDCMSEKDTMKWQTNIYFWVK